MRISFLVPRCTPDNSHGRYFIELAKRFSREHVVTVYAGAFWSPLRTIVDCRYLPVPNRPAVARIGGLWGASLLARRRTIGEIVHVNGADAPVGNVVTAQCCNAAMQTAGHSPGIYRRFNFAMGVLAEKYCMSKPTTQRVIAISRKVEGEIEREYGVQPHKVVVIYHGVDLDTFNPQNRLRFRSSIRNQLGVGKDQFLVVFVGGDYRLKGLKPLLKAAARVVGKIRVIPLGVEPDSALRRFVNENNYHQLVTFVGNTSKISEYYAAADCFVLPTLYDTFSMATLEAMAAGLPVIVSREAGVTELVTPDRDCLVLEDPHDVDILTHELNRLFHDSELRLRLGQEARATAEKYSWDKVAERTFQVYQEALSVSQ